MKVINYKQNLCLTVILSFFMMFLLSSCTTHLTKSGNNVRIIQDKEDYNYTFIATVSGYDTLGINTGAESENALNQARNKAALQGANAIQVIHMQTTFQGTSVIAEALLIDFSTKE